MPKIVHCGLDYSGGGGGSGEANFIELTQGEYDALTYEEKHDPNKMYMISDSPEAEALYFDPIIYSVYEREVGVWTDGKPLYQKTIIHNTPMPHRTWVNIVDDSSITIKRYDGYLYLNGGLLSSIDYHRGADSNEYCCSAVGTDGTVLNVWPSIGSSYTITCEVTIWYTKVADAAGSGDYASNGVPAVHYTTDEQVIGTWIDGKTLYQKTVALKAGASLSDSAWSTVTLEPTISNVDSLVFAEMHLNTPNNNNILRFCSQNGDIKAASTVTVTTSVDYYITFQYTKTAD